MTSIPISAVRVDGGTQSRVELNEATVAEYAAALVDGAIFPPITTFFDGEHHWLADGFHRHAANERVGNTEIEADIREGSRRDAIAFSLCANEKHGLRRSQADKRQAVLTALADPEWTKLSGREIAKLCGVSHDLVARVKREAVINDKRASATKPKRLHYDPATAAACQPVTANVDAEVAAIIDIIGPLVRKASREARVEIRDWPDLQIELGEVAA
jgi:hypothetical protein